MSEIPFMPALGRTVNIAATTATANVSLANGTSRMQVRVHNAGTVPVFVTFGVSGVTASLTTDVPIAPGSVEVLTAMPQASATFAAAITASGAATVYFTPGSGI